MKYIALDGQNVDRDVIMGEFSVGQAYGNVRLGHSFFVFKSRTKIYYISYANLSYCFRRVMLLPAGILRSRTIPLNYIVLADSTKELAQIEIQGESMAKQILDEIKKAAPAVETNCPDFLKSAPTEEK